jgi:salicylate hydroxylase
LELSARAATTNPPTKEGNRAQDPQAEAVNEWNRRIEMTESPFRVVIIGGGIGGLCLAQGLKKAGISAQVYERDRTPTSRIQGYRIHISPRGAQALQECLPPELWNTFASTCGKSPDSFRFLTHKLEELLRVEVPESDQSQRHYSASRIRLRQVLLAGLDDIVHFDKAFTRYEQAPDQRVTAFFEDGTSATGDLLVAADGGNSRVRNQFLPEALRIDTGIRAIGGKVILTDATRDRLSGPLLRGPALVRAPGGCALFLAAQEYTGPTNAPATNGADERGADPLAGLEVVDTQSYLMWALSGRQERSGFPSEQGQMDGSALRELALKVCSGWHPDFSHMIAMTDPSSINLIRIRTSVPVAHWQTSRITLIGDAVHSMTPYRGIGGNVALRDASLLCHNLTAAHHGEMPLLQAVHDYEAAMLEYGFNAVRTSLRVAEQAHSDSALALALGNAMFRLVNAFAPLKARMFRRNEED